MRVRYSGEQVLSIDGHMINKGINEVPDDVGQKMQDQKWLDRHGKDHFDFTQKAATQQPVGGAATDPKLKPNETDSFGLSGELRDKAVSRGMAGDSDIPGDSEQKEIGGSEDVAAATRAQEQDKVDEATKAAGKPLHARTSDGKLDASKATRSRQ